MKKNNPDLPTGPVPRQIRGEESLQKPGQPLTAILHHYEQNIRRFKRTWYAAGGCILVILTTILVLLFNH